MIYEIFPQFIFDIAFEFTIDFILISNISMEVDLNEIDSELESDIEDELREDFVDQVRDEF